MKEYLKIGLVALVTMFIVNKVPQIKALVG